MLKKNVTISLEGCVRGAALCFPAAPGIIALSVVFGTVAAQKGLTFLETIMINSLVFAGASQFVAMEVYGSPLTWGLVIAMIGVTAAVNMRMLLIGASLRPWLGQVPAWQTYPALFFLTDLNWLPSNRVISGVSVISDEFINTQRNPILTPSFTADSITIHQGPGISWDDHGQTYTAVFQIHSSAVPEASAYTTWLVLGCVSLAGGTLRRRRHGRPPA